MPGTKPSKSPKSSGSSKPSKSRGTVANSSKSPAQSRPSPEGNPSGKKSTSSSATGGPGTPKPHKHSGSANKTYPVGNDADKPEIPDPTTTVFESMTQSGFGRDVAVLAVVESEQKQRLKDMVKPKNKKIPPNLIITTPRKLQRKIDSITTEGTPLHLLVSSIIDTITYHVSENISQLHISSCGAEYPNTLRIGSRSTYCGFKSLIWDYRPADIRRREIKYNQGCYFDPSDAPLDVSTFSPMLKTIPGGTGSGADDAIVRGFADLQEEVGNAKRNGTDGRPPVSPGRGPFANPRTANGEEPWWTKWKHLVALVLGGAAGGGAAGGVMWCSAGGVFFKGPFGLQLAAGYMNMGFAGGAAAAAGLGCGLAAVATVYLIPWDKVFGFMKRALWWFWEKICNVVCWVWAKLKEAGAALVSLITG